MAKSNNKNLKKKGKYTPEAKLEVLAVLEHNDNNINQTAKDTGVPKGTIHKWIKEGRHHAVQEEIKEAEVIPSEEGEKVGSHITAEEILNDNKVHINHRQGKIIDRMMNLQEEVITNLSDLVPTMKEKKDVHSLAGLLKIIGDQMETMKGSSKFKFEDNSTTNNNTQNNFFEDQTRKLKERMNGKKAS